MTNEIQIVSDNGAIAAPRAAEAWTSPSPGPAQRQNNVLKKIHRLLRGRYPLALGLGLAFGAAGAAAGWLSKKPLYQSTALIQVKATVINAQNLISPDVNVPNWGAFIRAQMLQLQSPDTIRSALQKPEWQATGKKGGEDQVAAFTSGLDVEQIPLTDLIKVTYADPDARVAKAGTQDLCQAYMAHYRDTDPSGNLVKQKLLEDQRSNLSQRLGEAQDQLTQISRQNYGTDNLEGYLQEQLTVLSKLESDVVEGQLLVASLDGVLKEQSASGQGQNGGQPGGQAQIGGQGPAGGQGQPGGLGQSGGQGQGTGQSLVPLSPEMIAQTNPQMQNYLLNREMMKEKLRRTLEKYGPNNPAYQRDKEQLDLLTFQIETYQNQVNNTPSRTNMIGTGQPLPGTVTPADLTRAKANLERMRSEVESQREKIKQVGGLVQTIQGLKDRIASTRADLDMKIKQLDQLSAQMQLSMDQIVVLESGDLPVEPSEDKRKVMAAAGFMGGSMLPVGMLLLIGLLDSRFRYSDDTETDMSGIPLLGILPNLPDLLSDPEQAATAAHCVHQIRTLLQINGHATDRRVYTITSASSGDGKTSLTLALGLSFAASGSRTLLIDADLVGAGLTARLGVRSERGVLEAMTSRNLAEFVRPTDVEDLSILPVGEAMGSHAGTVSPAYVRRMVTEARKHYDTILIDTGPILGSIEASPVAVAADAVILCVARGQQRPLVDRALSHLQSIGARLAGVVFNRAQARDFEQSVSRMTMHSLPAANGNGRSRENGNGHHMGPVAKAVASSVRPAAGNADAN